MATVGVSPDAKSGYGSQTRGILEALSEKHEVVSIAQTGDTIVWGGTRSYRLPGGKEVPLYAIGNPLTDPGSAAKTLKEYEQLLKLDLVIGHWDLFALQFLRNAGVPHIVYVPVDSPMTQSWYEMGKATQRIVAYCEYGAREFLKFAPPAQIARIPHGLYTDRFRPLDRPKAELRKSLDYHPAVPENCFLFMHVGTNVTERKQLPQMLRVFALFVRDHPDAHLLLHANEFPAGGAGYDLRAIATALGIVERVHFPNKNPIILGATEAQMAQTYNAANAYLTLSQGEGWGVPLVEAMACGVPCVAGDNSSHTELVKKHGWLYRMLPPGAYIDYPMYTPYGSTFPVPDLNAVLSAMDVAYRMAGHFGVERRCRKFAEQFDWNLVGPQWVDLVDEVLDEVALFKSIPW